mmetsp:Transcript_9406/g.14377  ORF Transcript_9406/g.14377 Transcript_9406/m.14377 type:complete len:101 (-) Transcript_9406:34-336(-)
MDLPLEERNTKIKGDMTAEFIKQQEFLKVLDNITKLQTQKPEFIKQFYEQAKLTETNLSETEVTSKRDYEMSRLNTKLWSMLERDRQMKAKQNSIFKKRK